jgi:hypothetical protein
MTDFKVIFLLEFMDKAAGKPEANFLTDTRLFCGKSFLILRQMGKECPVNVRL